MGNTHSSMGLMFGSVIGGIVLAPFTGGASLAAVGIASGVGTAVGGTAFTINALNNRDAPEGEELKSFLIGAGCGAMGPVGGFAAGAGAEVSLGFELAGAGIGIGATNAGDDKFKPYIGNQQEAIKHYTQKNEKERYEKEVKKDMKKEEADKMNSFIKQHSNELISFYQFSSKKIANDTRLKMYSFKPYKNIDKKTFTEIQTQFTCKKDEPKINRIYVIRRKLDTLPLYFGWMAHSGILMNTKDGRWFICEYGVENDKNKVSLYEVSKSIKSSSADSFEFNGRKWNKQICGEDVSVDASISTIKETMENKMKRHSYWMLFWNCHMAQEGTRESLGLKVENKYLDKKYREELNFVLSYY
jgi:hypothetical protein